MKFRKKPVVIDAWPVQMLIQAVATDWAYVPVAVREAYEKGGWVFTYKEIHISTLEGTMVAALNDMVIQGVKGEFYPCKPDIFAATYEPVLEV